MIKKIFIVLVLTLCSILAASIPTPEQALAAGCNYTYQRHGPTDHDGEIIVTYSSPWYQMEFESFVETAWSANLSNCAHRIRSVHNILCYQRIQGRTVGVNCGVHGFFELSRIETDPPENRIMTFKYYDVGSTGTDGKDSRYGPWIDWTDDDWIGSIFRERVVIGGHINSQIERHYGWWHHPEP